MHPRTQTYTHTHTEKAYQYTTSIFLDTLSWCLRVPPWPAYFLSRSRSSSEPKKYSQLHSINHIVILFYGFSSFSPSSTHLQNPVLSFYNKGMTLSFPLYYEGKKWYKRRKKKSRIHPSYIL